MFLMFNDVNAVVKLSPGSWQSAPCSWIVERKLNGPFFSSGVRGLYPCSWRGERLRCVPIPRRSDGGSWCLRRHASQATAVATAVGWAAKPNMHRDRLTMPRMLGFAAQPTVLPPPPHHQPKEQTPDTSRPAYDQSTGVPKPYGSHPRKLLPSVTDSRTGP